MRPLDRLLVGDTDRNWARLGTWSRPYFTREARDNKSHRIAESNAGHQRQPHFHLIAKQMNCVEESQISWDDCNSKPAS